MTGPVSAYALSDAPIARNFWAEAVPDSALSRQPLTADMRADVVVIGAGYTGLNAALTLAEAGRSVVVLDRRFPGWGASGRNGGFCCLGGTRTPDTVLNTRFGAGAAEDVAKAEAAAVDHVAALADRHGWDIDRHSETGELCLAHSPAKARAMARDPGYHTHAALASLGFDATHHGGILTPRGFALHPRKYLSGLLSAVEAAGANVHGNSPAESLAHDGTAWQVGTPAARITATSLILATNGYSSDTLLPWMRARFLPAQSSVVATRGLTPEERVAQGWTSGQMAYENRRLLHYFHVTPQGNMVFGQRGGLVASAANEARIAASVRSAFARMFPAWSGVETPWAWSGMVCATAPLTPFCGPVPGAPGAFAAFGYHGNGVAMGSYLGHCLGLMLTDRPAPVPRAFAAPPPRFPLGRYRRLLLAAEYAWARLTGG